MSSFEVVRDDVSDTRFTDVDLLQLRLDETSRVIAGIVSGPGFPVFNDWQQDTLERLSESMLPDQTVDLPTRTGKSYLVTRIAAAAQAEGLSTVIVAPRNFILDNYEKTLSNLGRPATRLDLEQLPDPENNPVSLISTQKLAVNGRGSEHLEDCADLVLIDEGHRALGPKTIDGIRALFPNSVRMTFTATPDYTVNRSVTQEYGKKIISKSIVEAAKEGRVPPIRAFLYKTNAVIDNLDPSQKEFTPRELRKLAGFVSRNLAIVDMAQDLIQDGRKGLITTIPGENLLHADTLKDMLADRRIDLGDGSERPINAVVVRGGDDIAEAIDDLEYGDTDVLLYCDVLREGATIKAARFWLNGRPRTSMVSITQDIGRPLEPKDDGEDVVLVDFLDESIKYQATVYDVLELDRATQAVTIPSSQDESEESNRRTTRDTYLRGLFRPKIVSTLQRYDNRLLSELHYQPGVEATRETLKERFDREKAQELAEQTRIWEGVLAKEHLRPIGDDYFMSRPPDAKDTRYIYGAFADYKDWAEPEDRDKAIIVKQPKGKTIWSGFKNNQVVLPAITMSNPEIDANYSSPKGDEVADPVGDGVADGYLVDDMDRAMYAVSKKREREMLAMAFGLGEYEHHLSHAKVGQKFGVTGARVSTLVHRALAEMRHGIIGDPIKPYTTYDLLRPYVIDDGRGVNLAIRQALIQQREEKSLRDAMIAAGVVEPDEDPKKPRLSVSEGREISRQRDSYYEAVERAYNEKELPGSGRRGWFSDSERINQATGILAQRQGTSRFDFESRKKIVDKLTELYEHHDDELGHLWNRVLNNAYRLVPDSRRPYPFENDHTELSDIEAAVSALVSMLSD